MESGRRQNANGTDHDATSRNARLTASLPRCGMACSGASGSLACVSNLGILIQGVGAAWAMTQMTSSADKVALVQTALMLPIMLISMPAGAIADMHDRRVVALISLAIALAGATVLTVLAWLGLVTPNILLALCFIVGSGMALFGPAWQASVSEQVPTETLPAAVALNGISYNIARSFGPAIGGLVVATAGAVAAFAVNAVLYLPLMVVLFLWNRTHEPSRLPRERLNRAIVSGVRYIANSPSIRIVLIRTLVTGIIGGSSQGDFIFAGLRHQQVQG